MRVNELMLYRHMEQGKVLNDMAFLKEAIKDCNFRLTEEDVCHKGGEINWRIKYLQA